MPRSPILSAIVGVTCLAALASGAEQVLDTDAQVEILKQQIAAALSGQDRFAVLPPGVTILSASSGHLPCFGIPDGEHSFMATPRPLDEPIESTVIRGDGFYLLRHAHVAGWGDDGQFVIASSGGTQAAVVDDTGIRRVTLPASESDENSKEPGAGGISYFRQCRLARAFFVEGRWMYLTSIGLITDESTTPIEGTEDFGRDGFGRVFDDAFMLLSNPSSSEGLGGRLTGELRVAMLAGGQWEHHRFSNLPGRVSGVVRCRDAGLLAYGNKLVRLSKDMKSGPSESELAAVLDAAQNHDTAKLTSLLPNVTAYSPLRLSGLASLLDEAAQKEFMTRSRTASGPALALRTLAQLIRRCQYYDGLWLSMVVPIHQNSMAEALVVASCADPLTGADERWLLRLDNEGRLHKLTAYARAPSAWGAYSNDTIDDQGFPLLLITGQGLARVRSGQIEWVEQSNQMRSMTSLNGSDSTGRIYFTQRMQDSFGPRSWSTWVFRPESQSRPAAAAEVLQLSASPGTFEGMGGCAIVDARGRLWISAPESIREIPSGPFASAKPRILKIETTDDEQVRGWIPSSMPALFCRDTDGQLYRMTEGQGGRRTTGFAGRGGSLFLDLGTVAAFIQDGTACFGSDLHALAEQQFDRLLAAAPERSTVSAGVQGFSPLQCLAVGRVLWVKDRTGIEAYADGKSLGISNRLKLLNALATDATLYGPLPSPAGPRFLLLSLRPGANPLWATQKSDGIVLESFPIPEELQRPFAFPILRPLPDFLTGRVYVPRGRDSAVEFNGPEGFRVFEDAGEPVLISDGRLLVRRSDGYRFLDLADPAHTLDLEITHRMALTPVLAEDDGTLLCTTPEGLAWLRPDARGRYASAHSIRLDLPEPLSRYLGRSHDTLYVATDAGTFACVPADAPAERNAPAP